MKGVLDIASERKYKTETVKFSFEKLELLQKLLYRENLLHETYMKTNMKGNKGLPDSYEILTLPFPGAYLLALKWRFPSYLHFYSIIICITLARQLMVGLRLNCLDIKSQHPHLVRDTRCTIVVFRRNILHCNIV